MLWDCDTYCTDYCNFETERYVRVRNENKEQEQENIKRIPVRQSLLLRHKQFKNVSEMKVEIIH